jgi:hypothetical protein
MAEQKINLLIGANFSGLQAAIKDVEGLVGELPGKTKPHFETLGSAIRKTTKDLEILATTQGATSGAFVDGMGKLQKLKTAQQEFNSVLQQGNTIGVPAANTMQRVGSSYNGLGMSINQLTREMPAFANSMQTGFMAISNNIPMLVDELGRLKTANLELVASGQPAKSVFKQLAGSLFSWQTALSVGVTLLTIYGPKIIDWVASLELFKEKIVDNATELQKYNQVQAEFLKNTAGIKKGIDDVTASLAKQNVSLENQYQAKVKNVSVSKIELENALALESAMKKRLDFLEVSISGTEKGAIRNAQQIAFQKNALDSQVKLVAELQKQYDIQTKIDNLKKPKALNLNELRPKPFSDATDINSIDGLTEAMDNYSLATDLAIVKHNDFLDAMARTEAISKMVKDAVVNVAISIGGQFMESLGKAASGAGNFSDSLLSLLGNLAGEAANAMIMIGTAISFAPGAQGIAWGWFAAGAALKFAAGFLGGLNSKSAPSPSGGAMTGPSINSQSNTGSALSFKPMSTFIEVGGQVRGNNLKISLINTDISNRRVK